MPKKDQRSRGGSKMATNANMDGERMDFKSILKDIEKLGPSHMTWKERKEMENRKVVALGGKPPKKHRLPLSVARIQMKKQKEREQTMLEESLVLGRFGGSRAPVRKETDSKRRPEDKVLRATEGHFRNGVLNVKHLLRPSSSSSTSGPAIDSSKSFFGDGKKKGGKKHKNGRGKKGGGRKRH